MFSDDYILRLIRQATQVIARVLLLKQEQRYPESHEALDQMLEEVTGMPAGLFKLLDDEAVYAALRDGDELDIDRLVIAADLLAADGDLLAEQGRDVDAQVSLRRALTFYLEAFFSLKDGEKNPVSRFDSIDRLLPSIAWDGLTPDMLFSLFSYDELTEQYARAHGWLEMLAQIPETEQEAGREKQDYYHRLLGLPDSALEAGGTSRQEIEKWLQA